MVSSSYSEFDAWLAHVFRGLSAELANAARRKALAVGGNDLVRRNLEIASLAHGLIEPADLLEVVEQIPEIDVPLRVEPITHEFRRTFAMIFHAVDAQPKPLLLSLIKSGSAETLAKLPDELQTPDTLAFIRYMNADEALSLSTWTRWAYAARTKLTREQALDYLNDHPVVADAAAKSTSLTAKDIYAHVRRLQSRKQDNLIPFGFALNLRCVPHIATEIALNRIDEFPYFDRAPLTERAFAAAIQHFLETENYAELQGLLSNQHVPGSLLAKALRTDDIRETPLVLKSVLNNPALDVSIATQYLSEFMFNYEELGYSYELATECAPHFAGHPELSAELRRTAYIFGTSGLEVMGISSPDNFVVKPEVNWAALNVMADFIDDLTPVVDFDETLVPPDDTSLKVIGWLIKNDRLRNVEFLSMAASNGRLASWAASTSHNPTSQVVHAAFDLQHATRQAIAARGFEVPALTGKTKWSDLLGKADVPFDHPAEIKLFPVIDHNSYRVELCAQPRTLNHLPASVNDAIDGFRELNPSKAPIIARIRTRDRRGVGRRLTVGIFTKPDGQVQLNDIFEFTKQRDTGWTREIPVPEIGEISVGDLIEIEEKKRPVEVAAEFAAEVWNMARSAEPLIGKSDSGMGLT